MSDIFENWKEQKFIVAPQYLLDKPEILIILTDISFWADNADSLVEWCEKYNCTTQGMTVCLPNEAALTMFMLKWL